MRATRTIWLAIACTATLIVAVPGLASAGGAPPVAHHGYPSPAAVRPAPRLVHPARPFRTHPLEHGPSFNVIKSNNWSGFATYGSHFRFVSTTYSIPSLNCAFSPDGSFDSEWAGLDGYIQASKTVEQVGTYAQCVGGTPNYFGFYEMYPSPSVSFSGVSPGDSVTARVYYDGSRWHLTLRDNTTEVNIISVAESCPSGSTCLNSSAEVISEVPNGGPPAASLADYGIAGFTQIAITDSAGHQGNFFSLHWQNDKIYEYDRTNGHLMQSPSKLEGSASGSGGGYGNQAFTDTAVNPS